VKIISWNINGYRAITGQNTRQRLDNKEKSNVLFEFINSENPDIICLQETKAEPTQISEDLLSPAGYNNYYSWSKKKKGYSGVVTFSKQNANQNLNGFGIEDFDIEGRFIRTDFNDFILLNIYFPNGTSGDERVDYKLNFYDELIDYCERLRANGTELIICGDYNTAHKEIDLARPKENVNTSGFMPKERVKLDKMIELGYIDTFREFEKEGNKYTWWSNRGGARERNVGWRIDYFFITPNLKERLKNCYHLDMQLGSDHCPIVLELD